MGIPFWCYQSGTYLELILERVATTTQIPLAALVMVYFRQVDNFLYSFKSKNTLHKIGFEINRIMEQHNLNLQIPFSTTKDDHYDFEKDHSEEVI